MGLVYFCVLVLEIVGILSCNEQMEKVPNTASSCISNSFKLRTLDRKAILVSRENFSLREGRGSCHFVSRSFCVTAAGKMCRCFLIMQKG